MNSLKKLKEEVGSWANIWVDPHRFGGREFLFGAAEVGHVHAGGVVDIPFPRSIRDALLADGLAEEHHWVPNSGWITFRVRSEERPHPCLLAHASVVPPLRIEGSNRSAQALRTRK